MTLSSIRLFPLLILATLAGAWLPGVASAQVSVPLNQGTHSFPDIGNNHIVTHRSVWAKSRAKQLFLGKALTNEYDSSAPGRMPATIVNFERGVVIRNASQSYLGKTYAVYGSIYAKYTQLGGVNGRLGLPWSDQTWFQNSSHYAQNFERGQIYYNVTFSRWDVRYWDE